MNHSHEHPKTKADSCCHAPPKAEMGDHCHTGEHGFDWLLWGSLGITAIAYLAHLLAFGGLEGGNIAAFSAASFELMNKMWWGIVLGIVFVGLLARVPREFVLSVLGEGKSFSGIMRACAAGVLLDLCSHGILLVGMKLYERGASIGQVMAFLIASPWNSLSLTFIMVALIGLKWTLTFIVLSMVLALISGAIFNICVKRGILPDNPNTTTLPADFRFFKEAKTQLKMVHWNTTLIGRIAKDGLQDSLPVLKWLFIGVVLAAAIRAFIPTEHFAHYFGATALGLIITVALATVIEVCSEGSTPIAADILTRAGAPGNSFAFLMAGVSTDYTEIMGIKESTKSWKIALFLPLITLPQVLAVAWIINHYSV